MEKERKKISLATYVVSLIIMVAIIIVLAVMLVNENKNEDFIEDTVKSVGEQEDNGNKKISNTKYIEMTENNYDSDFRIQSVINNNDGTYTIRGSIYRELDLPNISEDDYNKLLNGETIEIFGIEFKARKKENIEEYGEKYIPLEYVDDVTLGDMYIDYSSENKKYELHYYTEIAYYENTGTCMEITLDENTKITGMRECTLKEFYTEDYSTDYKNIERFPLFNDEFIFENGKCVEINISGY